MSMNVLQPFALAVRDNGTFAPFSGEAWQYAGEMTLLGMGMVFAVLGLLWAVLTVFKLVFAGKTPKAPKEKPKATEEKSEKSASVPVEEGAISAVIAASIQAYQEDNNAELVAVLTAAVAAYRAEEGSEGGFRVVSFKRSGSRAWNAKK